MAFLMFVVPYLASENMILYSVFTLIICFIVASMIIITQLTQREQKTLMGKKHVEDLEQQYSVAFSYKNRYEVIFNLITRYAEKGDIKALKNQIIRASSLLNDAEAYEEDLQAIKNPLIQSLIRSTIDTYSNVNGIKIILLSSGDIDVPSHQQEDVHRTLQRFSVTAMESLVLQGGGLIEFVFSNSDGNTSFHVANSFDISHYNKQRAAIEKIGMDEQEKEELMSLNLNYKNFIEKENGITMMVQQISVENETKKHGTALEKYRRKR